MTIVPFQRIGKGVYTITEAERLTKVPRRTISRWTRGYVYRYKGELRQLPPIIGMSVERITGEGPLLSFSDILEIRFLDAFRKYGVSSRAIRIATQNAKELLGRPHPFSTRIFKTDGRTIIAEIAKGTRDKRLLDVVSKQYVFEEVIADSLYTGIDFDKSSKEAERWWPLGRKRSVVIDPQRSFGAPVVINGGIPTKILADAVKVEESIPFVAKWYDVTLREVRDAVEFEKQLAA